MPPSEQPARLPCYTEAEQRAGEFAKQLLRDIPELEGVAIVMSWEVQQDRLPAGLMTGRNGPLRHAGEMMRMALQLHRALKGNLDAFLPLFGLMDEQARQLAELINQRQQELDDYESRLCAAAAGADAPAGERQPAE